VRERKPDWRGEGVGNKEREQTEEREGTQFTDIWGIESTEKGISGGCEEKKKQE